MAFDPERVRLGRRGLLAGGGALALSALVAAPASAAETPPNPLEKPGWILDRHDEFNGALDPDLWIPRYLESRTTVERATARYGFRNNALVLRIDDDQPTYYHDDPMKVSSIQTGQRTNLHKDNRFDHAIPTDMKYTPQYGYFEIRAKSSARSGIHTAFWLTGRQDTWEQRGEVDIVEHAGVHGTSRFNWNLFEWSDPNLSTRTEQVGVGFDMTTEMHLYALEWTPTQLKLYIDNVLTRTIDQSLQYPAVFYLGIYEHAGWTGTVDPGDRRPKELVVDYFRAYKRAAGDPQSGQTYRIRNVATGRYLDSGAVGAVTLEPGSAYDDQLWTLTERQTGYWTIDNVREGRGHLDTDPDGKVIWSTERVGDDTLWAVTPVSGGFRIDNKQSGRGYLYGSGGSVGWNTGAADANTVWALERR
ncbi:family 16 glycosylhydrolase [Glycomyces sp. TRM65418]|uniref:family 16 glycosylhydrolase n=1 Tax=Glycomyces sp. TRM65418 TaxID=2867006 RepID=UPI001CE6A22E|nr:family 16 glycosylhydrolase [Glycomyces sp. TRM65418]MCC3761510.1 family 16 glycosylhydrolase [Glycomyces sp. TRM65418]QZD55608.1 family 16 glycosylhydrolase [Glycomyces sp. TRM65418]